MGSGYSTPEEALASLQSLEGFPPDAASAIRDAGSVSKGEQASPDSGVSFVLRADSALVAEVHIMQLDDGTWAPGGWTHCE